MLGRTRDVVSILIELPNYAWCSIVIRKNDVRDCQLIGLKVARLSILVIVSIASVITITIPIIFVEFK